MGLGHRMSCAWQGPLVPSRHRWPWWPPMRLGHSCRLLLQGHWCSGHYSNCSCHNLSQEEGNKSDLSSHEACPWQTCVEEHLLVHPQRRGLWDPVLLASLHTVLITCQKAAGRGQSKEQPQLSGGFSGSKPRICSLSQARGG